jgi:hypothetical protein
MAWKPDDIMKFTIDGTRVFVNTGITITKLDKSIQINLTDAAKAQFSGTKTLTLEMLPIPGYTITGGPLVTQVYNP